MYFCGLRDRNVTGSCQGKWWKNTKEASRPACRRGRLRWAFPASDVDGPHYSHVACRSVPQSDLFENFRAHNAANSVSVGSSEAARLSQMEPHRTRSRMRPAYSFFTDARFFSPVAAANGIRVVPGLDRVANCQVRQVRWIDAPSFSPVVRRCGGWTGSESGFGVFWLH